MIKVGAQNIYLKRILAYCAATGNNLLFCGQNLKVILLQIAFSCGNYVDIDAFQHPVRTYSLWFFLHRSFELTFRIVYFSFSYYSDGHLRHRDFSYFAEQGSVNFLKSNISCFHTRRQTHVLPRMLMFYMIKRIHVHVQNVQCILEVIRFALHDKLVPSEYVQTHSPIHSNS